ncbi:hypothetical protein AVEN_253049-1 [Araneus ventricosus]|uniref:Uncharacterized protein n=1 Tax=Araneus ventricosus TaxID=182803 RepID=A0A4Y2UKF1_ARAVE|nr:hypothetical protein AVEN_194731-1 [Araneus ventricosus]GBO13348.1 hypothetical protein AVEN_253049-1 [Araneus ventricosus]
MSNNLLFVPCQDEGHPYEVTFFPFKAGHFTVRTFQAIWTASLQNPPSMRKSEENRRCEDTRTAAKIGPAKVATWIVGKTPKENSPKELLFTPYLVTLGTQNLFGNSQLRRSDGCLFSVELRRDYP